MIKTLIVGDKFMDPELFKERIYKRYGTQIFDISTLFFPYPVDMFPLFADTVVPSGMSFEDPREGASFPNIREFYGDPYALSGKLNGIELLIIHGAALPQPVIDQADMLRTVIALRGGPVNVDTAYLEKRGIKVLHTSGKNAEAVAEFVLASLLSFERNVCKGNAGLLRDVWMPGFISYNRGGMELKNCTFGLVGYGRIARKLRELLSGFGCRVLVFDPFVKMEGIVDDNVELVSLDELCLNSDYISLHARLDPGAAPLIDKSKIAIMKSSAVLINTARGPLLDYRALKSALANGAIRGAVLDVYGSEPFSFYKDLLSMPNVLSTPHIAGATRNTVLNAVDMTLEYLKDFAG